MSAAAKNDGGLDLSRAAPGMRSSRANVLQMKVRAGNEGWSRRLWQVAAGRHAEAGHPRRPHRSALPVDRGERFFHVQFARLTFAVAPIPVEQAKGGVTGLLNFRQQHAASH